jgi:hypothetical protein
MEEPATDRTIGRMKRVAISLAVGVVLALFAMPFLGVVFYGGAGAALGGLSIIAMLIAIQYPLMWLVVRRKK